MMHFWAVGDPEKFGYRHPAKLVVLDTKTGKEIRSNDRVSDVDDLYFDTLLSGKL